MEKTKLPVAIRCPYWNSNLGFCRIDQNQCKCGMQDTECNKMEEELKNKNLG